jgi:hypothetical protein
MQGKIAQSPGKIESFKKSQKIKTLKQTSA